MSALLAMGSAFFLGFTVIITRIGLRRCDALSALLINMVASLLLSLTISLFTIPLRLFASRAVLYFIAAGCLGPCTGRFLLFVGINRVGASIASPLSQAKPLFAALVAVGVLGEELTLPIALGTLLIFAGAATISSEESGGSIEKKWSKRDLVFPLLAGACIGISQVLRKMGLNVMPEPILGVTVQNAAALAFSPLLVLSQRNQGRQASDFRKALVIFSVAGFTVVASQMCFFYALHLGTIVVVSPLNALSPFFVLLLTRIFLRKLEKVTWKIMLGSALIVGGTMVLTLMTK
jgi:uncharacterized membrane protein